MQTLKQKKDVALKTLLVFLVYFSYSYIIQTILNTVGITDSILCMFIADVCFFAFVIILYKNTITENIKKFFHEYTLWKKVKIILGGFLCLFIVNMIGAMLTSLIIPSSLALDDNTEAIYSLSKISIGYTLFKTVLFSIIAEELVFKKAVRDVISDNTLFVIVSSVIYGLVNIAYSNFSVVTITDFIQCFLFSTILSYIYVKYEDNIIVVMFVKFAYNLIPITLMFLGV